MKTEVDNGKFHNLALTEAVDMAQNWPLGRLLAESSGTSQRQW